VVALTLAVLAIGIWRALVLAHRFSRPIEELVEESDRIRTGDLDAGPPIRTRISEVQQLASAHDRMRRGLATLLKLERDLLLARQIQQNTWPRRLPELAGFDLAAFTLPADETGGDSYDVIGLQQVGDGRDLVLSQERADRALLLLADATGHGVGPALSVTQLRSMLRMAVRVGADLPAILTHINEQLFADLPTNRFVTAWFGLLDTAASALTFISAGQAPLLHYLAAEDRFEVLTSNAVPLGLFPQMTAPRPQEIVLAAGDLYAVLSDGFYEAESPAGEEQGVERICDLLRHHRNDAATAVVQAIQDATEAFTGGAPPNDDRTIILIQRRPPDRFAMRRG
jgi:phosphoserine phosphatase